jgi:hypothetical protein
MARFVFWLALAWPTPALIAGALGWKGVWGSGSALGDYLIPIPVAGGVLHVLTFASVTILLLAQRKWPTLLQGAVRGILLGLSLAAVALLLDLNVFREAATSDVALRRLPWQENPLGLFLLTDTLIAQPFLASFDGRWPAGAREWQLSAAAVILLPAVYAAAAIMQDSRSGQIFTYGGARDGRERGDESVHVFTRLPVGAPEFRREAERHAAQWHPEININTEDTAVHFYTSLEAAKKQDATRAVLTYCMYEDGTPPAWMGGAGDCFSQHENFSERMKRFMDAQDRQLPMEERLRLARAQACDGAKLPQRPWHENQSTRTCLPRPP